MLNVINDGIITPTRIMYACNMSWQPFMKFLNSLINEDLISFMESDSGRCVYNITEKGRSALEFFEDSKKFGVI